MSEAELDRLDDFKLEVGGKHPLGSAVSWSWTASFEREELSGDRVRNRFGVGLGFERRF